MTAFTLLEHPRAIDHDRQIILADLRRIRDLRVFLKSSMAQLKRLERKQSADPGEILREKTYISAIKREIAHLRHLVAQRAFSLN